MIDGRRPTLQETAWLSGRPSFRRLAWYASAFTALAVLLFLSMDRRVGIYDESFVLTAALRTLSGQVIHRDFYYAYGPAQPALLAVLFKMFGISLLVERLSNVALGSVLTICIFKLLRRYCRPWVAFAATVVCFCWSFELSLTGLINTPCAALNIGSTALLLRGSHSRSSRVPLLAAGALDGLNFLFRYDVGLAIAVIHVVVLVVAMFHTGEERPVSSRAYRLPPFLLGLGAVVVPSIALYLSVAPLSDFVFDLLTYPHRHYFTGRSLPFPRLNIKHPGGLAVYLPAAIVPLSLRLFVLLARGTRLKREYAPDDSRAASLALLALSLMAVAMYAKSYVRISAIGLYLCTIPCILLLALLYEYRSRFSLPLRTIVFSSIALAMLAASSSAVDRLRALHRDRRSVWTKTVSPPEAFSALENQWCRERNRVTAGVCFLPPVSDMESLNYLAERMNPNEFLYVGLRHHDRVFTNDNFLYFATGNLPSTRWSQFDPGLQNDPAIQRAMVADLRAHPPPYVVLDSSSETEAEPNDSSSSTGAVVLDEYIHDRYRPVAVFETMTILKRAG